MTEVQYKSKEEITEEKSSLPRPSSPRRFFARLYGHLEEDEDKHVEKKFPSDVCRPQPLASTSLPFSMFGGTLPFMLPRDDLRLTLSSHDAHLAGFSAFCK